MTGPVALKALPPSSGDAPLAAVVLRDLAAALVAGRDTRPSGLDPAAAEVADDGRIALHDTTPLGSLTDLDHAALAAPELFAGVAPDGRSDVYAAALLTLSRYLGTSAVAASVGGHRANARMRLAAQRQSQRTVPARLGALPAPFRAVFTQSVAKEPYLRPTPERLVALLDAALAAAGDDVEAAARTRLHRLVVLARAFEPSAAAAAARPVAAEVTHGPHHLPLRPLPAFAPSRRFTRAALVAAVTVLATGGVAAAAVVGFRGDGHTPVPQAVVTPAVPTPSPSAPSVVTTPAAATSTAAATVPAVPATPAAAPAAGGARNSGGDGNQATPRRSSGSGSGRSGSGGSGSGSHSGGSAPKNSSAPVVPPPVNNPPPAPVDPVPGTGASRTHTWSTAPAGGSANSGPADSPSAP